uniref:Protein kinase domain-containing protein n=1 Tax=Aotus nancymaae TaxID=37293 RepID=A0A2K5F5U8_AOTNA
MAKQYDLVECPFCDEVTKYEKLAKIGQGTFGEVFKAKHRKTGQKVALKKVLMENEKEGFPITFYGLLELNDYVFISYKTET